MPLRHFFSFTHKCVVLRKHPSTSATNTNKLFNLLSSLSSVDDLVFIDIENTEILSTVQERKESRENILGLGMSIEM